MLTTCFLKYEFLLTQCVSFWQIIIHPWWFCSGWVKFAECSQVHVEYGKMWFMNYSFAPNREYFCLIKMIGASFVHLMRNSTGDPWLIQPTTWCSKKESRLSCEEAALLLGADRLFLQKWTRFKNTRTVPLSNVLVEHYSFSCIIQRRRNAVTKHFTAKHSAAAQPV